MGEETDNISQDKKIDNLQWQMKSLQEAFIEFKAQQKNDFKEFQALQKETNNRLEIMQKGFVGREEYQEFKKFVGTLATQKDVDSADRALVERVKILEDWQTWTLRTIVGFIIVAVIGAAFVIK